jgi:hypothetical protein
MARKAGGGKVIVLGIPGIDRALKQLPLNLQKKVIRKAMRESLRPVKAAVYHQETEGHLATGFTAENVALRAGKSKKRGRIAMQVIIGEGWYLGATFYAAFEEFGHFIGSRNLSYRTFHAGSHRMERAFAQTAEQAKADCEWKLRLGVDHEVSLLGKGT